MKSSFVVALDGLCWERHIRTIEHGIAPRPPLPHHDSLERALKLDLMKHLRVELAILLSHIDMGKAFEPAFKGLD